MTYPQAQLIVHNPDAYTRAQRIKAAALILANLRAKQDDVTAATLAV